MQLLLATAEQSQVLTLPPSAMQLPQLRISGGEAASPPDAAHRKMLAAHRTFLTECRASCTFSTLIGPLSALLHDNGTPHLAIELWVALLPQVWSGLTVPEQESY